MRLRNLGISVKEGEVILVEGQGWHGQIVVSRIEGRRATLVFRLPDQVNVIREAALLKQIEKDVQKH